MTSVMGVSTLAKKKNEQISDNVYVKNVYIFELEFRLIYGITIIRRVNKKKQYLHKSKCANPMRKSIY